MNTGTEILRNCEEAAIHMRKNVLKLALMAGPTGAHLGGCLSIIEILAALYCGVMKIKPENPKWEKRDRFILSKGQGSLAHYTALEASRIISEEELFTYGQNGGLLPCAASFNPDLGIEYSNGTLGFGLTYAVGLAFASKKLYTHIMSMFYLVMGNVMRVRFGSQRCPHHILNCLISL